MRKIMAGLVLMGLALVAGSAAASAKIYGNARFGYFIEIPAAFPVADPEPENGDGQTFHPADKSAELNVAGSWIIVDNFAAELVVYKDYMVHDGWKLTYENQPSKSSAVYTGQRGDRIFYARQISSCGGKAIAGYRLEYAAADKAKYNAVIKTLNTSLHSGQGSCN